MVKYWAIAAAIGSLAMTGCTETIFKPFDADKGSVSMDARQRAILSVERGTPREPHRIVCAEPSPDALATIAASAGLSGSLSGLPQFPGKAELASSFASGEQAGMIGARNSTIQLLRDGLYRACEAYMNGALGDFGYGLVLVNYGRVMVSLLTADGLTHPALVQPVVIGSTPGAVTTQIKDGQSTPDKSKDAADKTQDAAKDVKTADDKKVIPAAAPAKDGGADREPATGADPAKPVTNPAAPGLAPGQLNDQAQHVLENVVYKLANPTEDPGGKFIEVAVACMLWLDNTGLKKASADSAGLDKLCGSIVELAPELGKQAIEAKIADAYPPIKVAESSPVRGTDNSSKR